MSKNAINSALRRMGYASTDMTGHGFRSMASTLLNEQGWNRDAIERQLAHGERDPVRAAYNYAEHLPERRKRSRAPECIDLLRPATRSTGLQRGGIVTTADAQPGHSPRTRYCSPCFGSVRKPT